MDRHQHDAHRAGLAAPALPPAPAAGLAPLGTDAAAPASLNPPGKDEAPGWQAEGFKGQGRQDSADCAVQQPGDQPGADDGKRFATLRARLALAGWALSPSLSLGTTTPNGINKLGAYCGVYGTTFV